MKHIKQTDTLKQQIYIFSSHYHTRNEKTIIKYIHNIDINIIMYVTENEFNLSKKKKKIP